MMLIMPPKEETRKRKAFCGIRSCTNFQGTTSREVHIFRPSKASVAAWANAIKQHQEYVILTHVCHFHFRPSELRWCGNKFVLTDGAIPSIFPPKDPSNSSNCGGTRAATNNSVAISSAAVLNQLGHQAVHFVDLKKIVDGGNQDPIGINSEQSATNAMDVSEQCGGCEVKNFKLQKISSEIYDLRKRCENQDKLIRYFKCLAAKYQKQLQTMDVLIEESPLLIEDDAEVQSTDYQMKVDDPMEPDLGCTQFQPEEKVEYIEIPDLTENIKTESNSKHPADNILLLKPFQCGTCNECFAIPKELQKHIQQHALSSMNKQKSMAQIIEKPISEKVLHGKFFKCGNCSESFAKPIELRKHIRSHDPNGKRTFECYLCKIPFKSSKLVKKHLELHDKYVKCTICYQAVEERKMDHHLCGEEKQINCGYCQQAFTSTKLILNHFDTDHPNDIRMQKCYDCRTFFESRVLMKYHTRYHDEHPKIFVCDTCSKAFETRKKLANHMKYHSIAAEGNHLCEHCGKSFRYPGNLKLHMRSHAEPQYKCDKCPQRFRTANVLRSHSHLHRNVRFVCSICDAELMSPNGLNLHMQLHDDVDNYFECPVCFKNIKNKRYLRKHMQVHKNNKGDYRCNYCSQSYKYNGDLNKHLKTHLGEKIHKCNECDQCFKFPRELLKHSFEHYKGE